MITRSEKNKDVDEQIQKEELEKKAKKITSTILKVVVIVGLIIAIPFLYMRFIATRGLIVREYGITIKALPDDFTGLKIVHITDFYYGSSIHKNELNQVVKTINKIKPDIIVFTGDMISKNTKLTDNEKEELINSLNKMQAAIGKFSIRGENDGNIYDYVISNTDFKNMDNSYELIYNKGLIPILLIGIDNKSNIEQSFSYYQEEFKNPDIFSIVLVHKPDVITSFKQFTPNIVLAGHSLNGSIKLPFIGGIIKPSGAKTYYDSEYNIGKTHLYISGGIGTNNLNLRLFNRPSLNLYRIRNT